MATKELKTKIALRYLDYATWSAEAFQAEKPLKGEVWFCEVPTGNANATTAPTMLFKIGDGVNNFGTLKWASALAADVYEWAKAADVVFENEHILFKNAVGGTIKDLDLSSFALDADLGMVANLKTTAKTAVGAINEHDEEIGDLSKLNTTNKGNLVNAINEALQAVEVGGTGSLVTVVKENKDKYVVKQGGNQVGDAIEIADATLDVKVGGGLAGTDVQFSANATENKEITISHGNTSDATNLVANGRKYVTGLTFDDYGHVTGYTIGEEVDQDLSHNHDGQYKKLQTAYAKELTGAQVVAKVEQNANGDVTVTERTLTAADLGLDTVMHFIGAEAVAPTKAFAGTANERDLASGDVYLNTANATEYVYSNGKWVELGNEEGAGSHALKTVTVFGTGYLVGGGDLSDNRTIDIATDVKTKIDNGAIAHGWGNHADAGYAKNDDLTKVINGTTPVAKAIDADTLGTHGVDYFATSAENGAKALADANKLAIDAINHAETGILAQAKAYSDSLNHEDTKYTAAENGGLKLNADNSFAIDDTVVFILNCN